MAPLVTFKATPELKTWPHRKATAITVSSVHGDSRTTKIRADGKMLDGDSIEMDDFEAQWVAVNYPDSFSVEAEVKVVPRSRHRAAKDEE